MQKQHCDIDIVEKKGLFSRIVTTARVILILFLIFYAAIMGSVYFQMVWLPFVYIYQPLQIKICEIMMAVWFYFSAMLIHALGSRVVITGDTTSFPQRCLVLMNHRTMVDWLYYWCLVGKLASYRYTKITLKNDLRNIPGLGWAPQLTSFIFLKRNWEKDRLYLQKMLSFYALSGSPYQLLIFPEGTNLHPVTVPKSNKFARLNNLPEYEYSLHPRSTGFLFMLDKLHPSSGQSHLDAIIDITIGFKGNIPLGPTIPISGYLPKEIHFHVQQHKVSDLPVSDEERDNWLREVWRQKEERLKRFYKQDYSFGTEASNLHEMGLLMKLLVILFWCSPLAITYLLWLYCPLLLLLLLLFILLFFFLQYKYDGVESFIASRYLNSIGRKNL